MHKKILFIFLVATAVMCFMFGGNVHYNFIYSIAVAVILLLAPVLYFTKRRPKNV